MWARLTSRGWWVAEVLVNAAIYSRPRDKWCSRLLPMSSGLTDRFVEALLPCSSRRELPEVMLERWCLYRASGALLFPFCLYVFQIINNGYPRESKVWCSLQKPGREFRRTRQAREALPVQNPFGWCCCWRLGSGTFGIAVFTGRSRSPANLKCLRETSLESP